MENEVKRAKTISPTLAALMEILPSLSEMLPTPYSEHDSTWLADISMDCRASCGTREHMERKMGGKHGYKHKRGR